MADNNTEILLKLKAIDELTPVMIKAVQAMDAQTSALTASMEKLGTATQAPKERADGLNTSMVNLASGLSIATTIYEGVSKAWDKIAESVGRAIGEAEEAEKAQNKLNGAMIAAGEYTQKNANAVEKYANQLEDLKGVSGEQTRILVAQSLQMGLNTEKAIEMAEAARMLANTQSIDANSAMQMLTGSINGQVKGLAKIVPGIKDLTQAQLKSGEAAKLVAQALAAQNAMYEGSFSASVAKAKNAVSNVYEAIGKMIIQNPLVVKGIQMFSDYAAKLAEKIDYLARLLAANGPLIEQFGAAIGKALVVAAAGLAVYTIATTTAAGVTAALGAAMAVVLSPITLVVAAVAALTAAFMKWPGLFDQIVGGIKIFAGVFVEGMAKILSVAAKVAGIFDKDLAKSLNKARDSMMGFAEEVKTAGGEQMVLGEQLNETGVAALKQVDAIKKDTVELDANGVATSKNAATKKLLADSYGGIILGTKKAQEALQGETQARDDDLKKFTQYLEAKKRTAVSKAEEQQIQLANVRAKEIGGTGGEESGKAKIDASIANEVKHMAELRKLREGNFISQKQFDEEYQESAQNMRTLGLQREQAHQQALADVYANSPAGYQARQAQDKADFEIKLANQSEQLSRLGQNEAQVAEFQRVQRAQFNQSQYDAQKAHNELMIQLAAQDSQRKLEAMGDTPEALQAKLALDEKRYQDELAIKLQRAQEENLSDLQVKQLKEQAEMDHKNNLDVQSEEFWAREGARQEKAGNGWAAFLAHKEELAIKHGQIMGTMQAVSDSQQFKGTQQTLGAVAALQNSHSKKVFEIAKSAAVAKAVMDTYASAVGAFNAMASIPFVGPVLAPVAAAAAIAMGMQNIAQIKSQKFTGGQADSGMDSIPQHLDGKSFVLSGGERVVQPTANKELTDFLAREKNGNTSSGGINITLNYSGSGSKEDAKKMADIVIQEIRSRSERGTPVISSKGVTS